MNIKEQKASSPNFLYELLGSFAKPAAENPTAAIMEAAFRHHKLHYRYINCEVGPDNLQASFEGAKAMGWRGFNCSIPNKVEVMKYLDKIGESAQIIGAVNTVIIDPDGQTTGENTDGKGFVKAISEMTSIPGKKIVIFGAGGAAHAIAVEMALAEAEEITILNVSERGKSLADLLNNRIPAKASFRPWNHTFSIPSDTDIVINATPVGLYPDIEQRLNIRIASSQYAIWIEDAAGRLVRTLYATSSTAKGGYEYRKDALPLWVSKAKPQTIPSAQVDAITGATPRNGIITYQWDGTDDKGNRVPPGNYKFFLEGTLY